MTGGLLTSVHATAHQAALLMARNRMGHVVVVDGDGRLAGVVSQDDLFRLQQVGVAEISDEIAAAKDLPPSRARRRRSGTWPPASWRRGSARSCSRTSRPP